MGHALAESLAHARLRVTRLTHLLRISLLQVFKFFPKNTSVESMINIEKTILSKSTLTKVLSHVFLAHIIVFMFTSSRIPERILINYVIRKPLRNEVELFLGRTDELICFVAAFY